MSVDATKIEKEKDEREKYKNQLQIYKNELQKYENFVDISQNLKEEFDSVVLDVDNKIEEQETAIDILNGILDIPTTTQEDQAEQEQEPVQQTTPTTTEQQTTPTQENQAEQEQEQEQQTTPTTTTELQQSRQLKPEQGINVDISSFNIRSNSKFVESQQSLGCGRHALNNLLMKQVFIKGDKGNPAYQIPFQNDQEIINYTDPIPLLNVCKYIYKTCPYFPESLLCKDSEDYDISVLFYALGILGFEIKNEVRGNAIPNDYQIPTDDNFIGYLVNQGAGHWTTIRKEGDKYRYVDSIYPKIKIEYDIGMMKSKSDYFYYPVFQTNKTVNPLLDKCFVSLTEGDDAAQEEKARKRKILNNELNLKILSLIKYLKVNKTNQQFFTGNIKLYEDNVENLIIDLNLVSVLLSYNLVINIEELEDMNNQPFKIKGSFDDYTKFIQTVFSYMDKNKYFSKKYYSDFDTEGNVKFPKLLETFEEKNTEDPDGLIKLNPIQVVDSNGNEIISGGGTITFYDRKYVLPEGTSGGLEDVGGTESSLTPTSEEPSTEKVGDLFVKLLPEMGDLEVKDDNIGYTKRALGKFKKYKDNLNNIELNIFEKDKVNDAQYIENYIKEFSMQIFQNISTKRYPDESESVTVPRENHGGLNHMRSLKFGIIVFRFLLESQNYKDLTEEDKKIFSPKSFFTMLMMSTMFESIMRIDERGSSSVLCKMSPGYFDKLYPELKGEEYNVLRDSELSPHQIASSVIYKILMKKCFSGIISDYDIDLLSRGVSYYWDSTKDTIGIKDTPLAGVSENTNLKFFIYYVIIIVGHYLDHCRGEGSYSSMIKNKDIEKLLDLFGVEDEKRIELTKIIVYDLLNTEFTGYSGGDIDTIENFNMKTECGKLSGRYENSNFVNLSLNFEDCWKTLGIENEILKSIGVYDSVLSKLPKYISDLSDENKEKLRQLKEIYPDYSDKYLLRKLIDAKYDIDNTVQTISQYPEISVNETVLESIILDSLEKNSTKPMSKVEIFDKFLEYFNLDDVKFRKNLEEYLKDALIPGIIKEDCAGKIRDEFKNGNELASDKLASDIAKNFEKDTLNYWAYPPYKDYFSSTDDKYTCELEIAVLVTGYFTTLISNNGVFIKILDYTGNPIPPPYIQQDQAGNHFDVIDLDGKRVEIKDDGACLFACFLYVAKLKKDNELLSPFKLKKPKSKYLSPTSKIKKERKKKKDKINKLKKNLKK